MRISDWSSDVCSSDLLLFERRQKPGIVTLVPLQFGGGPLFTLWAKAEFTEDEYALLQKYRFNDALLIADDWLAMLQRSFRTAVMLGFVAWRSEEHTSELQSLMRISYAVFCWKKKNTNI